MMLNKTNKEANKQVLIDRNEIRRRIISMINHLDESYQIR